MAKFIKLPDSCNIVEYINVDVIEKFTIEKNGTKIYFHANGADVYTTYCEAEADVIAELVQRLLGKQ